MEFRRAMERLGLVTRVEDVKQMRRLWRMLDEEDAGIVDYRTFCIKLFPECAPRKGGRTGGRVGEGGGWRRRSALSTAFRCPSDAVLGRSRVTRAGALPWSQV